MMDVRITKHKATKSNANFVTVIFYEGLQNLIGTNYVKPKVDGQRLYFYPSEKKVKGAVKLNRTAYIQRGFDTLVKFVGEYPLDYDTSIEVYYVDLEKRNEVSINYTNSRVPHPNYKAHKNEPYESEEKEMAIHINNVVEVVDTKYPVYEALIKLLIVQIKDKEYKNAIFTSQTIQNMLEREE